MKNESRIPAAKVLGAVLAALSLYVIIGVFVLFDNAFNFANSIPALWLPLVLIAGGYRIWAAKLLFVKPANETYAQAGRMIKMSFWISFIGLAANWYMVLMHLVLAIISFSSGGVGGADSLIAIEGEGGLDTFTLSLILSHVLIFVLSIVMMIVMRSWKAPRNEAKLSKKAKTIAVLVTLAVFVVFTVNGVLYNITGGTGGSGKSLTTFRSFTMHDIMNDNEVTQDILKGKVTFINIWATWCGPCKEEMPALAELSEEYKDSNVQILAVCSDSVDFPSQATNTASLESIKDLINELNASDLMILQPASEDIEEIERILTCHPTTFVVDEDGNILEVIAGGKEKSQWNSFIQKYVK